MKYIVNFKVEIISWQRSENLLFLKNQKID